VLEAFRARDAAAVASAAAASKQDPWLVADALCERSEFDAAAAFEKLGWKGDQVKAPRGLGQAATDQRKSADAVGHLTRAMAIVEPTNVINAIVPARIQLAEAQEAAGDRKAAEANFRECATWVEALGDEEDLKAVKDGFARLGLTWGEAGATAPRRGGDEDPKARAAAATGEARKRWTAAQAALAKGDKAHAMGDLRAAAESLASPAYEQSAARKELDGVFREGVSSSSRRRCARTRTTRRTAHSSSPRSPATTWWTGPGSAAPRSARTSSSSRAATRRAR